MGTRDDHVGVVEFERVARLVLSDQHLVELLARTDAGDPALGVRGERLRDVQDAHAAGSSGRTPRRPRHAPGSSSTNSTACSSVIQNRVMRSSVIVMLARLGLREEQRDHAAAAPTTLPYRTHANRRPRVGRVGVALREDLLRAQLRGAVEVDRVDRLVGATAQRRAARRSSIAAATTFSAPMTFVWTASNGLYSQAGTCLSAAAWTMTSTPRVARISRSRSRTSPMQEPQPVLVGDSVRAARTA